MQNLITKYDSLVEEYRQNIINKFDIEDFRLYNEVLFASHNCGIEGNSFSVDDTRALKEQGLGMIPHGKSLFEAFEILDHFKAYEYLFSQIDEPLSEKLLKATHRILTEHTLSYRLPNAVPGEYTDTDMAAGDTVFGDHRELISQVPKLLESTQRMLENDIHPMTLAAKFHCFFEFLHPFRDGNGRIGRLFANFILAKKNQPIVIIERERKEEYITALKFYKKESSTELIETFFLETAIRRMENEIAEKKNLTRNFVEGFLNNKH